MKKLLLIMLVALLSVGANAQIKLAKKDASLRMSLPTKTVDLRPGEQSLAAKYIHRARKAEGEAQIYSASGVMNGWLGDSEFSGQPVSVTVEGNTYTIQGVFPDQGATIVATREGNTLTVDKDKLACVLDYTDYDMGVFDCFVGEMVFDEAYENILEVKNPEFVIDEDGVITQKDPEAIIGLYDLSEGVPQMWAYNYYLTLTPVTEDLTLVAIPEGIEPQTYMYAYTDLYATDYLFLDDAVIDGEDVYLHGLTDAWIKGTLKDGKAFFPTSQYIGDATGMFLYFCTGKLSEDPNDETSYLVTSTDGLTLQYVDGAFVQAEDDDTYVLFVTIDGSATGAVTGVLVKPYAGDVDATPVDPEIVSYNFDEAEGYTYLNYNMPNVGTEGEFLNPEKLFLRFWYDDFVYEFDPSLYVEDVVEPTTLIPWTQFTYNMYFGSADQYLYILDMMFEKIGVQAIYCGDKETRYSHVIYVDGDGNISQADGIGSVLAPTTDKFYGYYDLQGRKMVSMPARGLYIQNGKLMLRR